MTESARDSYGGRRWTTMSSGKPGGQARSVVAVESLGFVLDRCRRHTGFDQLDPPAIHDFVAGRRSNSHGPAEMMGDPDTHALEYLASQV